MAQEGFFLAGHSLYFGQNKHCVVAAGCQQLIVEDDVEEVVPVFEVAAEAFEHVEAIHLGLALGTTRVD